MLNTTADLQPLDMLAHANLAHTLGHGLHPWCSLDSELRALALQLVRLDPTLDIGLRLLTDEPEHFAAWCSRESKGLRTRLGPLAAPRRRPKRVAKRLIARHGRLHYTKGCTC